MYLLDTNHLSRLIQREETIYNRLRELGSVEVATSVVVVGELFFMAHNSQQKAANLVRVKLLLRDIQIWTIDKETAEIYGQFKTEIISRYGPKEKSQRRKTPIAEVGVGENDLWIAATALRHSLTVVSADSDFERMRAVRAFPLENWLDSNKDVLDSK